MWSAPGRPPLTLRLLHPNMFTGANNMKSVIHENFENGRRARAESPLPFGLYKLKEVRRYPDRVLDTLDDLIKAKKHKQPLYPLYGGSPKVWVRGWLREFAYRLGKDLVPSIEALTGDGLPAAVIHPHMAGLRQREQSLLSELEHADWQIRSWGVKHEYALWERGESVLLEPSVNFLAMTEIGLRLVDDHLPGHLSNHDRAEFFQPHPKVRAG